MTPIPETIVKRFVDPRTGQCHKLVYSRFPSGHSVVHVPPFGGRRRTAAKTFADVTEARRHWKELVDSFARSGLVPSEA